MSLHPGRILGGFLLLVAFTLHALDARELDATAALQAATGEQMVLVDVRTPSEWKQTGIPAGAAAISVTAHPEGSKGFVADVLALVNGDRTRPVAVICRTGRRSAAAQKLLEKNGFTRVYNVTEGMAGSGGGPGWLARGLPTEPCPVC